MKHSSSNDLIMFGTASKFEVVCVEHGPTKIVNGNNFQWTDNFIGDISKASMIRIGIKTLRYGNDGILFFAEEKTNESKGITYYFDRHNGNRTCSPGYK